MSIATINPATGESIRVFDAFDSDRLNQSLDRASAAFEQHRHTSFAARAECMRKAAGILEGECRELGRLMTLEMGKPIKAAIAEAEKCATACNYYAENAQRFLADEPLAGLRELEHGVFGVDLMSALGVPLPRTLEVLLEHGSDRRGVHALNA